MGGNEVSLDWNARGEVNSIYKDTEIDMFVELSKYFCFLFKLTFVFSCFTSENRGNHSDVTRYRDIIR